MGITTMPTHPQQWHALNAQYDALFDDPDISDRQARVNELRGRVLLWDMVQLDPSGYLPDDLRNYKRAAERAARWLNRGA